MCTCTRVSQRQDTDTHVSCDSGKAFVGKAVADSYQTGTTELQLPQLGRSCYFSFTDALAFL